MLIWKRNVVGAYAKISMKITMSASFLSKLGMTLYILYMLVNILDAKSLQLYGYKVMQDV